MDSAFDPATFLNATTTEASTRRSPLPAGDYTGVLGEPKFHQNQGRKDPTQTYNFLDVPVTIDLSDRPDLVERVGQDRVTLNYSGRFDLSPSGGIDYGKGKSPGFRQVREAVGLNAPGQPFSPSMLIGRPVKVRITHETYEGELRDRIDSVSRI